MEQKLIPIGPSPRVTVAPVSGDLQVTAWDRPELMAKTDGDSVDVTQDGDSVAVSADGDLIVYAPPGASLEIADVVRDADLRGITGRIRFGNVGGDLQLRNTGPVRVLNVTRNLSARSIQGDFQSANVGDDASLRQVQGSATLGNVGSDLLLNDIGGDVSAMVGGDAVMYLRPRAGGSYHVQASGDILLRLPADANAELDLQGGSMESVRVDFPGVQPFEEGLARRLTLGAGGARINLIAGEDLVVTTRAEEWHSMAEFNSAIGPEGFPDVELGDMIARQVERATRHAESTVAHAVQQAERARERGERAVRRADQKMRAAERRGLHIGVSFGRGGVVKPFTPPSSQGEPVSDEERLTILRMLQEKKITAAEAEKLLSALENR